MLGLIKKDLLLIKGNLKLLIITIFIYLIITIQGENDLTFIPIFMSIILFMSTFSYDEYNKWDSYAITFPSGRKNIVKSKYLATFILIVASILVTFILSLIVGYFNNNIDFKMIFESMLGCIFAILIMQSLIYPLIFKYGIEKGRIGIFVISFAITLIGGLISSNIDSELFLEATSFISNYGIILFPLITIIAVFTSYKMSKNIYLNKEF